MNTIYVGSPPPPPHQISEYDEFVLAILRDDTRWYIVSLWHVQTNNVYLFSSEFVVYLFISEYVQMNNVYLFISEYVPFLIIV
jgi:hypothetical protein